MKNVSFEMPRVSGTIFIFRFASSEHGNVRVFVPATMMEKGNGNVYWKVQQ